MMVKVSGHIDSASHAAFENNIEMSPFKKGTLVQMQLLSKRRLGIHEKENCQLKYCINPLLLPTILMV